MYTASPRSLSDSPRAAQRLELEPLRRTSQPNPTFTNNNNLDINRSSNEIYASLAVSTLSALGSGVVGLTSTIVSNTASMVNALLAQFVGQSPIVQQMDPSVAIEARRPSVDVAEIVGRI